MQTSRRRFLQGAGGCAACLSPIAGAGILPTNLEPLVSANYEPSDPDERGAWQSLERLEEWIRTSPRRLQSPELEMYTRGTVERLVGRAVPEIRMYLMREASFNASMAPNGMMIVHTGFMARVRNEAQYAAVLGHEAGHYFRKHGIERYRSTRRKSATMAFIGATANAAAGYTASSGYSGAQSWIDAANAINQALFFSMFQFSRAQEAEADAYGIGLMARSGFDLTAASQVWDQLIQERKASAAHRHTRYKDDSNSALSTHPPSENRMEDLADTAAHLATGLESNRYDGRAEWSAVIAPYLPMLLEEQIKLNDPGASLYLLQSLAADGWTSLLRFNEGEVYRLRNGEGDEARAAEAFAASIALPDAPAEAWRAHGYSLIKAGKQVEGREALAKYLALKPDAKDAGIVRHTLAQ
jgi:predicted Zn-dependent protease